MRRAGRQTTAQMRQQMRSKPEPESLSAEQRAPAEGECIAGTQSCRAEHHACCMTLMCSTTCYS